MKTFRPLLASPFDPETDMHRLKLPINLSPKVDGIRCVIHPEFGPVTRSLKPIPNNHIRHMLNDPVLHGLDGEIVVGPITATDVFNVTTSAVMSQAGSPSFTYYAFDTIKFPDNHYTDRRERVKQTVMDYPSSCLNMLDDGYFITAASNLDQLKAIILHYEEEQLKAGYEGIMIRCVANPYKYGRSTLKEGTLLKLKRVEDAEATIVGFEELLRNKNEQTSNALGLSERSDHKAGMQPAGTLGALLVENSVFGGFRIGSGFDEATRAEIWGRRDHYKGKTVTFKYQKVGVVDKPRFPIFKGLREDL